MLSWEIMTLSDILPYIQIVISILLAAAVLLQHSSAGIGAGLGGDNFSTTFHTRRGFEKFLFNSTIILGILFAAVSFITLII